MIGTIGEWNSKNALYPVTGLGVSPAMNMKVSQYSNSVVIITGGGRGIGRGIARAYAEEGATVVLFERDESLLQACIGELRHLGLSVSGELVDVRDPMQIQATVRHVAQTHRTIDILINNAGVSRFQSLFELTVEEWDDVINTNLRGTFLCSREVARVMRAQGGGAIVNIASTRALMSEPDAEAYAATKGGIMALTHALAISLGPHHIRVNCISPGWIETGDYGQLRDIDHLQHPSLRVGTPEDIARACLFLTHPDNGFITGENLVVDGGMTKKMVYEP